MKERPILFSTDMVRAILDGKKTQTRRVITPQPKVVHGGYSDGSIETERIFRHGDQRIHCPYGQVGDMLWVKETWQQIGDGHDNPFIVYKATSPDQGCKWRPSIFMPRWASRITLEITEVRVQRVQEITRNDAIAEGVIPLGGLMDSEPWCASTKDQEPMKYPEAAFGRLWDSLNAKRGYSWESNPWCWCICFKRIA